MTKIIIFLHLLVLSNVNLCYASSSYQLQLEAENQSSWSPLHWAVVHGIDGIICCATSTVSILLDEGADIEVKDSYRRTPLHLAISYDQLDIAKLLIERGADTEAKDRNGNTVLHGAANTRKPDAIKLLVEMNANLNAKDENGITALDLALKEEYGEEDSIHLIKPLILNGADLETRNWQHLTPFQRSITYGWLDTAELLLDNGADINAKDNSGKTILNFIIMQYHSKNNNKTDAIEFLLKHGADTNIDDEEGLTPLHYAALKHNTAIAKMLLNNGSHKHVKDKNGETPLDKAKMLGNSEMIELLK